MKRAAVADKEVDRLADLAGEAGFRLRVRVDFDAEARFEVPGLGSFDDVGQLECALNDSLRVTQ